MFFGGLYLFILSAAAGEFRRLPPTTILLSPRVLLSMAYLIVAASILAYTAYVWLIAHDSPTRVSSYAYVNPVVAVIVGYFLGGETVGPRTLLGTLLVLVSVIAITTPRAKKPVATPVAEPLRELAEP